MRAAPRCQKHRPLESRARKARQSWGTFRSCANSHSAPRPQGLPAHPPPTGRGSRGPGAHADLLLAPLPAPPPAPPGSCPQVLMKDPGGGHLLGEGPGPPAQHGSPLHVPSHGTPLLPEPTQAWAGILLRRSMAKDQSPVCALEKLETSHQGRRPGAPEVWVTALMTQGRGGRRRGGPSPESSRGLRDLPLPPWGAL